MTGKINLQRHVLTVAEELADEVQQSDHSIEQLAVISIMQDGSVRLSLAGYTEALALAAAKLLEHLKKREKRYVN